MEVVNEIKTYNESDIIALAYNHFKKEIYTASESEKIIKVIHRSSSLMNGQVVVLRFNNLKRSGI